jgi:hypothetical protein
MKYYSIISGTVLLMALSLAAFSQEARLSYNLVTGKRYLLDIVMQQNTRSESLYSEEISIYNHMKLEFRVDSADPSGLIHLSVRYNDLLLSMLAPGMGLDINSETGKNRVLSDLIDSLQLGRFRVSMAESGELRSIVGLDSIFISLASYPVKDTNELEVILNTLDEAYGPNAFQSLFNLFVAYYPNVQPINNWTRDLTYYFNTKPVQMVNRYYLSRTTEEVLIIQGMGMINSLEEFSETISMGDVKSAVSGTQTYDYQADRETGWLKRCVSRQRVLIETTILKSSHLPQGLKIPSYTETVFEVKGRPYQAEKP